MILHEDEEDRLVKFVRSVRNQGAVVDRWTLVCLAEVVLEASRPGEALPQLTHNWVRGFRRRHGLSRLLSPSSDRPVDQPADLQKRQAFF
jgi:hypothetical protein